MQHFSKEQMQKARRTDLYDFLIRHHFSDFKKVGKSIHPIDNGSLSIKRGYSGYLDFATNEKGNSVDFLTRHMGYELDQAVLALCGEDSHDTHALILHDHSIAPENLPPVFPEAADGPYRQLFAYLTSRGIPAPTIQGLIDRKLLYQSKYRNNMVFINYERDWAELRGTYTFSEKPFRGMVANCRTDGFWCFQSGKNPKIAYVCEAAIDAISLYIIKQRYGCAEAAYYVSIGGVAKQPAIDRLKRQTSVVLAVDNDQAGQECRNRNPDLETIIPLCKDWNEDLQYGKYYGRSAI